MNNDKIRKAFEEKNGGMILDRYESSGNYENIDTFLDYEHFKDGYKSRDKEVQILRDALRNVAEDYDHDEDAHKYGTVCRQCNAQEALAKTGGNDEV